MKYFSKYYFYICSWSYKRIKFILSNVQYDIHL